MHFCFSKPHLIEFAQLDFVYQTYAILFDYANFPEAGQSNPYVDVVLFACKICIGSNEFLLFDMFFFLTVEP